MLTIVVIQSTKSLTLASFPRSNPSIIWLSLSPPYRPPALGSPSGDLTGMDYLYNKHELNDSTLLM